MSTNELVFHDIADYYIASWWKNQALLTFIISIGVLICFYTIYLLISHYKAEKHRSTHLSADEWAFKELEKIKPLKKDSKKEYKVFYIQLVEILKKYLSRVYENELIHYTDDELISYLKEKNMSAGALLIFHAIIEGSRLIRFANAATLPTQANEDYKRAWNFIKTVKAHPHKN